MNLNILPTIVLTGVGATLVMDLWLLLLQRLGIPTLNFAFIGRWVGHLPRGRVRHRSIAASEPISHELALGWVMHYATGIAFAALLLLLQGPAWARQPSLLPALTVGLATAAFPLLLVQPAMGAGVASSKTPSPIKNCLKSLANHAVFGAGLYLCATLLIALTA